MPRPPRVLQEDGHYHVYNRGHSKQPIFLSEAHFLLFLDILAQAAHRFEFELYAYALMKNHYHLQLSTPAANLSKIMEYVGRTYAKIFNKDVGRLGPLWQGRFKSIVVDSNRYLLHLNRYIHQNPVKSGYVSDPLRYKWSSLTSYTKKNAQSLINCGPVLSYFDKIEDFLTFTNTTANDAFESHYRSHKWPSAIPKR